MNHFRFISLLCIIGSFAYADKKVNDKPLVPTACSASNQGRCECGDASRGFQTYTFWMENVQRCFTVFHPTSRASEKLPVLIQPNCYAEDRLVGMDMTNDRSPGNTAATRYGYSRIGVSTPDHDWVFGNNNIVNDDYPMPCSDDDSSDIKYMRAIFEFVEANPDQFDSSRMYAEGFSQNSMFSAYIGHCFNENVLGVWQGGSGMGLTGQLPYFPGCQGQVTASDYENCNNCPQCINEHFCNECQYWPIYPCYNQRRPMVSCNMEYTNDPISTNQADPDKYSSATYMYEKLMDEGHDARLLRFSPTADFQGGHRDPENKDYWHIGCLGITPSCSTECEFAFIACVEEQKSNVETSADAFRNCINNVNVFTSLGCEANCAPTFDMMSTSQAPSTALFLNFGAGQETADARPESSLCVAN